MMNKKGFALIIVIFAMMVFAVLGWTLAIMQSTDFEVNLRNLDSEQALELAEAGVQYALQRLSLDSNWRVTTGTDCADSIDWLQHNFASGQYAICCRNPAIGEVGNAVIETRGYIPNSGPNYRAMRQVKLEVSLGSLTNAVMTQASDPLQPDRGLLNWWPARQDDSICIEGTVSAGHYNGDGNAVYDQLGSDYDPLPAPILPDDCVGLANSERIFTGSFPSIDLQWFYDNTPAGNRWPSPPTRQLIAPLTAVTEAGGRLETSVVGFFTGMTGQAVRLGAANWYDSDANWRRITAVLDSGRDARVTPAVGAGWQPGVSTIKLMRRFAGAPGSGLWYTGGQIAGGTDADLLIDARTVAEGGTNNTNLTLSNTYLMTEGTILIKGTKRLRMNFTGGGTRYPNLATENGKYYFP
ncbi:MAG: hypothetical protein V2A64_03120 [Candidatus Omnitrophota bacterium]